MMEIFVGWHQDEEAFKQVLQCLVELLLPYVHALTAAGADILCYADPAAMLWLVGPQFSRVLTQHFTLPFLRQVMAETDDIPVHLCPHIVAALDDLQMLTRRQLPLPADLPYEQACLAMRSWGRLCGQHCLEQYGAMPQVSVLTELQLQE